MSQEIGFVMAMSILIIGVILLMYAETVLVFKGTKTNKRIPAQITAVILAAISFVVFWLCNKHQFNVYNNFSYLAEALLNGRLDVPDMPAYLESVAYKGKQYMHFAPGPSLLSLPFVAIWGIEGFNCALLAMFLGACNLPLAAGVLAHMNIGKTAKDRVWLGMMLTFGTVHFFCASQGSSWFLGHVATLFFLLLSFWFLTAKKNQYSYRNLFLSGLFFGLAVTCRLAALFGFVFIAGYLMINSKENKERFQRIFVFCCGAAIFGFLYMAYNFARYGTIMDMGYNLTYLKDYHREAYDALQAAPVEQQPELFKQYREECGGPLQLKFVGFNLYSIFCMLPQFKDVFPYVIPTVSGVAVTFTSPMLYCGILADKKQKLTWILAATMVLTAIPFLMNYGNGTAQFGMRYSMDFTPYLWLLMCMGLTRKGELKWWMKIGIALCIIVNGWGTLYWTYFY